MFHPGLPWRTAAIVFMILSLAVSLPGSTAAREGVVHGEFYQKLEQIWSDVQISPDAAYWRAPERTPKVYVCPQPAARDIWVSCDRWPDGSDPRRFGRDAVRLSKAKTDHEKALAVYRWVRRWMIYNNKKGCPTELLNLLPTATAYGAMPLIFPGRTGKKALPKSRSTCKVGGCNRLRQKTRRLPPGSFAFPTSFQTLRCASIFSAEVPETCFA